MKTKHFWMCALAGAICWSMNAGAGLTVVNQSGSSDGNPPGTLYTVMQNMLGSQAPNYDVNNPVNRVDDSFDQVWTAGSVNGGTSTLLLAIAGYAGNNSFGIYNLSTGAQLPLFNGTDNGSPVGTTVAVTFSGGNASVNGGTPVNVGTDFGFYLGTPGSPTGRWSSVDSANPDLGDHMVTLTTKTPYTLNPGAAAAGWPAAGNLAWNPGSYILGWEDLPVSGLNGLSTGDVDYQDMIVEVSGVTPVPEPTTLISGALLLLPFGAGTVRILRRSRRV